MTRPIAHTDVGYGAHDLERHLRDVGAAAATNASAIGASEWARLAGHGHDLGKYSPAWQAYIRACQSGDATQRSPGHSIAGAVHAIDRLGECNGRLLAYCIAGHHAGLPDWESLDAGNASLKDRLAQARKDDVLAQVRAGDAPDWLLHPERPTDGPRGLDSRGVAAFIRMLFSALVDADYLDAERHFAGHRASARGAWPTLSALVPILDAHLDNKTENALRTQPGAVNEARRDVLHACRERAHLPPGLFTLTVPTGIGKTLTSLSFALRHALAHGNRRVIYAIPYTSIIEQTTDVFRSVFGSAGEAVVEHHSSVAPEHETYRSRLAAENWDAPLVVTTTVQLFESLFAARPARCRKLHNIANSVLILDEAQLLPVPFLRPILWALDELMARYGVTVVLSTATQPALMARDGFAGLVSPPRELAPDPERLRRTLSGRTRLELLHGLKQSVDWPELAGLLQAERRVLCIVDRRRAARDLYAAMPPGTYHLSALMCPQHRSDVIAEIRARLADPHAEVRVVSTQLIEAGVDLDFPCVFRSIAGLDSIAQAAGRCNREGLLATQGRVVVFRGPELPPPGLLRQAASIGRYLLEHRSDPLSLSAYRQFFSDLYWSQGDRLDSAELISGPRPLLGDTGTTLDFSYRTAAERFRIIPDDQAPIIVPYGDGPRLAAEIEREGISRERMRGVQRSIVGVDRQRHERLLAAGHVREISPGLYVLADSAAHRYSVATGLRAD